MIGFDCLKATEPLPEDSLLSATKFPEILGTLSRPWSHPMVFNSGTLDWESSALTTRPLILPQWQNPYQMLEKLERYSIIDETTTCCVKKLNIVFLRSIKCDMGGIVGKIPLDMRQVSGSLTSKALREELIHELSNIWKFPGSAVENIELHLSKPQHQLLMKYKLRKARLPGRPTTLEQKR